LARRRRQKVRAKCHPQQCNGEVLGPQKLTFLRRFDQNVEYKCPAGRIICAIFTKFAVCTLFQDALAVKISLDLLKGLWSYGVFKLRSLVTPNFELPLAVKLCIKPPRVFEVQERARGPLSPCQVWWGSDFTRRRGGQKR